MGIGRMILGKKPKFQNRTNFVKTFKTLITFRSTVEIFDEGFFLIIAKMYVSCVGVLVEHFQCSAKILV